MCDSSTPPANINSVVSTNIRRVFAPWWSPASIQHYLTEALRSTDVLLEGITFDRLQREGPLLMMNRPVEPYVSFRDYRFETPSGRIELYKEELIAHDAQLPFYRVPIRSDRRDRGEN
jgi:hypothetical protein